MRNFIACLLLLGLLAGLSACGADDSYLSVRTHVEPSIPATETPQQEEPPTAGNRSELRGAMLSFVRNWTERGEIRISGYSGDLTADLTETVRYITQEDPIGAYAVDYADAELRGDAQTGTRRGQHRVPPLRGGDRCYRDRERRQRRACEDPAGAG